MLKVRYQLHAVHFSHTPHKTKTKRQIKKKHEKPISGRFSRQLEPATASSIIRYFHFLTVRHESRRKFKTHSVLLKKAESKYTYHIVKL